jgi:hypothetical protein
VKIEVKFTDYSLLELREKAIKALQDLGFEVERKRSIFDDMEDFRQAFYKKDFTPILTEDTFRIFEGKELNLLFINQINYNGASLYFKFDRDISNEDFFLLETRSEFFMGHCYGEMVDEIDVPAAHGRCAG